MSPAARARDIDAMSRPLSFIGFLLGARWGAYLAGAAARDDHSTLLASAGPCPLCGQEQLRVETHTVSSLAFLARIEERIFCGCGERIVRSPR
jgi:hypothetical protein